MLPTPRPKRTHPRYSVAADTFEIKSPVPTVWMQKFPHAATLRLTLSTNKPVTMRPTTAENVVRLTAHPAAPTPTMGAR